MTRQIPERNWTGVLGGAFDPVHLGHLYIAEEVRRAFDLDRILLVPCAEPPQKPAGSLAPAEHRLAMLRLAVSGRTGLSVDPIELQRGGTSYTIDTLRELRGAGRDLEPLFVLGMDALRGLHRWKEHEALLREFHFVAVDRADGGARDRLSESLGERLREAPRTPGDARRALETCGPGEGRIWRWVIRPLAVSSSSVRRRIASGEEPWGLVPPAVGRYIQIHHLYRQETVR